MELMKDTRKEWSEEERDDMREKRGDKLHVSKRVRTGKNKEEEEREELRDKMEDRINPLHGINE
jgi:hypothetical protein